jgi:hypothetical protein
MSTDMSGNSSHDTDLTGAYAYDEPMVGPLDSQESPSGFHPVNVGHLVMGVAFAGMVLVWALLQGGVVETSELDWLMPVPWLLAGAAGLAATVWGSRRSSHQ